jgi:alcohol dehydrogenase class IV
MMRGGDRDAEEAHMSAASSETIFTWGAPPVKFGTGAVDELAHECAQHGLSRVLLVTDPGVAATGVPERVRDGLTGGGVEVVAYDDVHVEPTDASFRAAAAFAAAQRWDGIVAVGGGSSIDTAKAMNLLTAHPDADLMDFVNKPVGGGRAVTAPLRPLIAVPTTAGTGAECTAVCVLDVLDLKVKTGISHPRLRPALAVVDPLVTLTVPPGVTASAGMDVLCHALESYTARSYDSFARKDPADRVAYCGANPISDVFTERALGLLARSFRTAVMAGNNLAARSDMLLAALFAGMGFGNAGVHIPHACAYPIAGRVRDHHPDGYPAAEPMVPHGQSVAVTAPAAFRFTFPADAERHLRIADLLDPRAAELAADPRDRLPLALTNLMRDIGVPNGLAALGYGESDLGGLVDGALAQQRLLATAPRDVGAAELERILADSFTNW